LQRNKAYWLLRRYNYRFLHHIVEQFACRGKNTANELCCTTEEVRGFIRIYHHSYLKLPTAVAWRKKSLLNIVSINFLILLGKAVPFTNSDDTREDGDNNTGVFPQYNR